MPQHILNQSTELVAVAELREHPRNPRRGNVEKIAESIRENGFYGYLIVQRATGYVLAGNHTLKAVRSLGWERVPVVFVDVDDAKAVDIVLADNATSDAGDYNYALLADLLSEREQAFGTLVGTGYSTEDLQHFLGIAAPLDASAFSDPVVDGESEPSRRDAVGDEDEDGTAAAETIIIPERWDVLVECATEQQQTELLERLSAEGFSVRALIA